MNVIMNLRKKFGMDIIQVVKPQDKSLQAKVESGELCFSDDGIAVNSGRYDGLTTAQFKEKNYRLARG